MEVGHEGTSCDRQTQVSTLVHQGPAGSAYLRTYVYYTGGHPGVPMSACTLVPPPGAHPGKKGLPASRIAFTASRLAYCQALPRSPIPSDRRGPVGWQPVSEFSVQPTCFTHSNHAYSGCRGSRGMGPSTLLGPGPQADGCVAARVSRGSSRERHVRSRLVSQSLRPQP